MEPELSRRQDPHLSERHYINIDYYGLRGFMSMPQQWEAAAGKFSADSLYEHGIAPWAAVEAYENLVTAFASGVPEDIVTRSVELSSIVGELNVPLHLSNHYDPSPISLTTLWESRMVDGNIGRFKLYDGEAKALKKDQVGPFVWSLVGIAYKLADPVVELENDATREMGLKDKFTFTYRLGKATRQYSDKFAALYFQKVGGMVSAQLKTSADAVATLWLTAWEQGGKPNLTKILAEAPSKEDKAQLAEDLKLRQEFKLVSAGRLLALAKPAAAVGGEAGSKPAADSAAAPAPKSKKEKRNKKADKAEKGEATEPENGNFMPSGKE